MSTKECKRNKSWHGSPGGIKTKLEESYSGAGPKLPTYRPSLPTLPLLCRNLSTSIGHIAHSALALGKGGQQAEVG
jgi:hypothetical protein